MFDLQNYLYISHIDFPTMFVRMNHVESARTQTHFIVGTIASLVTSFVPCLDFVLPPCSSVVTSVCHWLMFVMGRLSVEMGQMRKIARIKVVHGCVREPFSKDPSPVFRVKRIRKCHNKYISENILTFNFSHSPKLIILR